MYVKPNEGVQVRDPATKQPIPEGGREVADTSYWRRRVADGDLVVVEQQQGEATPMGHEVKTR